MEDEKKEEVTEVSSIQPAKAKKPLSPKAKRIINIVVDVVVAVILVFALILAVSTIVSKRKGYKDYTEIFGSAYLAVQSGSMEPVFYRGDLIKIDTLKSSEISSLKEQDIITFKDTFLVNGSYNLNTHRIIEKRTDGDGVYFITRGDNNPESMTETVRPDQIVGVYKGKASGIGKVFLFMQTSTGFFVCVVLPTLLIVVYCAVNLVLVIRKEKKKQTAEAIVAKEDERERIRQELLAEMQASVAPTAEEKPTEQSDPESQPQEEPTAEEPTDEEK